MPDPALKYTPKAARREGSRWTTSLWISAVLFRTERVFPWPSGGASGSESPRAVGRPLARRGGFIGLASSWPGGDHDDAERKARSTARLLWR